MSLTAERARQLLSYNPDSGILTWRASRGGILAGTAAGTPVNHEGRMRLDIGVDGRMYRAHRLVWLITHGEWPKFVIDHINGDPMDNCLANLRDVPCAINSQNRRCSMRGKQLPLGVKAIPSGRYTAEIYRLGVRRYLGVHDTPEAAYSAYVAAKREFHPGGTL